MSEQDDFRRLERESMAAHARAEAVKLVTLQSLKQRVTTIAVTLLVTEAVIVLHVVRHW